MSKVLFTPVTYDKFDADQSLPPRFERLLDKMAADMGLADAVNGKLTAVKMHVGRRIGFTTIHPLFVKILVDKLKGWGAKVYLTDQTVEGCRARGYTEEYFGCPIVDVCGVTSKYYYEEHVSFRSLKNIDIGGNIKDADVLIDLSHVKGHQTCAYGGAVKNIAMGCVTDRTRGQIHSLEGSLIWDGEKCTHCGACIDSCNHFANKFDDNGVYTVDETLCTTCRHCVGVCPTGAVQLTDARYGDFQTGMALCTEKVLSTFAPGSVFYINFLMNITALCDCWGMSLPALTPDYGIAASQDIVGIEKACIDTIKLEDLNMNALPKGYQLFPGDNLFQAVHGRDPYVQLRELEKLGLGSLQYDLETIY